VPESWRTQRKGGGDHFDGGLVLVLISIGVTLVVAAATSSAKLKYLNACWVF